MTDTVQPAGRFTIAADHPSLAGHFPGHPVVPGVVLLDEVLACLPPGATLVTAKFTAPVAPGMAVDVRFHPEAGGRTAFACFAAGRPVLSGAVLSGAVLSGAVLSGAVLSGAVVA